MLLMNKVIDAVFILRRLIYTHLQSWMYEYEYPVPLAIHMMSVGKKRLI